MDLQANKKGYEDATNLRACNPFFHGLNSRRECLEYMNGYLQREANPFVTPKHFDRMLSKHDFSAFNLSR